jgi:hypothetical protein
MAVEAGFDLASRLSARGETRAIVQEKNPCSFVRRFQSFVAFAPVSSSSRFALWREVF